MRGKRLLAFSVAVLVVALAAALFIKESGKGSEGSGIIVVVTIPPQAEFVKRVGGEKVAVITMVPQWANPHTYEPTPAQLMNVSKAKMLSLIHISEPMRPY